MSFSRTTILGLLKKGLLLGVSIVLACLILEVGLRFSKTDLGDLEMIPIHWILTDTGWTVDPDLIYAQRSVLEEIEKVATRSSKAPLILTLGDSFTAGDPFPDEESFPSQLKRELAAESINVEVLNVGHAGYNPDQELIMLKKILQKGIRPKIVVWSFYPNDFYESGQWPNFTLDQHGQLLQLSGARSFIFQRQKFYEALPLTRNIKENSAVVGAMLHFFNLKINQEIPREFRDPNTNFDWVEQKFKLEIQAAKQLADQNNFTLIFVSVHPQTAYFTSQFLKDHQIEDDQSKEVAAFDRLLSQEKYYLPLNLNTLLESGKYPFHIPQCVDGATYYFNRHHSENDDFPLGQHHFNELGYLLFGEIVKTMVKPLLLTK